MDTSGGSRGDGVMGGSATGSMKLGALLGSPLASFAVSAGFVLWNALLIHHDTAALLRVLSARQGPWSLDAALDMASRLAFLAFLGLMTVLIVVRRPPLRTAAGALPAAAAVAGSIMMMMVASFPRVDSGPVIDLASTVLLLTGGVLSVVTLAHLGRSFSVLPQGRRLVTSGPYGIVRHPLYLTEEIAILGVFLQHLSLLAFGLLIAHAAVQLLRMRFEEEVLEQAFSDYPLYRARVPMLIPRMARRPDGGSAAP